MTLLKYALKKDARQILLDFDIYNPDDKALWDDDGNQLPGVKVPFNVDIRTDGFY